MLKSGRLYTARAWLRLLFRARPATVDGGHSQSGNVGAPPHLGCSSWPPPKLPISPPPCHAGARISALVEEVIYPMLEKALENNDPMAAQLDMPRCKAVLRFWTRDVQAIFTSYAAADMDVDAQAAARLYAALCGTACTHILYLLE